MDALSTPVFRSFLVAAAAMTSFGAYKAATHDSSVTHRLSLHAHVLPNAIYLSAFSDGDIDVTFPDSHLHALTISTRARVADGCRWLGVEKLTPMNDKTFYYEYSETILECDAGATPWFKTPRTGTVTVEK
ncbi:MAG TPA: hypothetical protein VGM39_01550 [Kofleriaceae bacterium]